MPEQEYLVVEHLSRRDIARIFSKIKINPETECWEWQGGRNKYGYGKIKYLRRDETAHRLLYAWLVGPIPRGLGKHIPQLDHLVCNNKPCCFPAHLRLVSAKENTLRSTNPAALNAAKVYCVNGHLLPSKPNGKGTYGRYCNECHRQRIAAETPAQREHRRQQVAGYFQEQFYGSKREEMLRSRREASRKYRASLAPGEWAAMQREWRAKRKAAQTKV